MGHRYHVVRCPTREALIDTPFTSDRCSVVPEYDQAACCVRHDWSYWQGGTWRERRRADREFYRCIRQTRTWWTSGIRYIGVRFGGVGILPTSWRWGYGWKWPRSQGPENDTSPFSMESQVATFEKLLEDAAAADERARRRLS